MIQYLLAAAMISIFTAVERSVHRSHGRWLAPILMMVEWPPGSSCLTRTNPLKLSSRLLLGMSTLAAGTRPYSFLSTLLRQIARPFLIQPTDDSRFFQIKHLLLQHLFLNV